MSTLDISVPPNLYESTTEKMSGNTSGNRSSNGIGARIMRQLRRNSTAKIEKPKVDLKQKNLNSKAIEKLYTNKTLGRFKQTQLETIFEQEEETDANEIQTVDNVFGKRKVKRSVSCSDGFNTTKTLKRKRKRRIQKIFGAHKKFKAISMKKFLERLQASDTVTVTTPAQIAGA